MKHLLIIIALLIGVSAQAQRVFIAADTNGVLLWPTNFADKNLTNMASKAYADTISQNASNNAAALWATFPPVFTNEIWVSSWAGDDLTGERGNPSKKFATIGGALGVAMSGDTIHVGSGQYIENNLYGGGKRFIFDAETVVGDIYFGIGPLFICQLGENMWLSGGALYATNDIILNNGNTVMAGSMCSPGPPTSVKGYYYTP